MRKGDPVGRDVEDDLGLIAVTPDVVYGHKLGMALTLDQYRPADANGAGVMFINSGGFESGKLTQYQETAPGRFRLLGPRELTVEGAEEPIPLLSQFSFAPLLEKGFTVFDVRHGSSPRFTLDEMVKDVRRAVRFVRCQADHLGVDPQRLGVWGASAGGYLAIFLALSSDAGSADSTDPVERTSSHIQAAATYYAAGYDFAADAEGFPEVIENLPALKIGMEKLRDLSIKRFITAAAPPVLTVYGTDDFPFITGACEAIHRGLQAAGATSKLVPLEGTGHEFAGDDGFHEHHAQRAMHEVVAWFERWLIVDGS